MTLRQAISFLGMRLQRIHVSTQCVEDVDNDGISDDVDECVGAFDECGICNGAGANLECGCEGIPDGACDCDGNQLDVWGLPFDNEWFLMLTVMESATTMKIGMYLPIGRQLQ